MVVSPAHSQLTDIISPVCLGSDMLRTPRPGAVSSKEENIDTAYRDISDNIESTQYVCFSLTRYMSSIENPLFPLCCERSQLFSWTSYTMTALTWCLIFSIIWTTYQGLSKDANRVASSDPGFQSIDSCSLPASNMNGTHLKHWNEHR